ncbi:hypothetical protein BOTCAL_0509g00060 [Botryotinia calthae]|uniref:Clr5 domain-containing protein n=1 Tax=Botryotinia calthae TaxID=38488 RepID=A0A4Y8CL74_9HELO|nr:hypothetical protein BOTCAL_0509g00060 [Botryotinia calthae]
MVNIINRIEEADRLQSLNPSSYEATYTEINDRAREISTKVLDNYQILRCIIDRKERALRQHWKNKSNAQRHYAQFFRWQLNPDKDSASDNVSHRNDYMHPQLNVEDLIKVKSMLLLINSRGRNPPHIFANADLRAADLGVISGALPLRFLKDHNLLLEGESTETYGRLVPWTDEKMKQKILAGFGHLPHQGLLILEIQDNLYLFLVSWCKALLQGIEIATIWRLPIEPEPPLLVEASGDTAIASIAMETPYRLPSKLDLNRMQAVVTAKRLSSEDYIHDLREDPGLFADALMEESEHRLERVLDDEGRAHSSIGTPEFWEDVSLGLVRDAYCNLIGWDIASKQVERLAILKEKYAFLSHTRNDLPEELLKELLSIKNVLKALNAAYKNRGIGGISTSLPFRHQFRQVPGTSGNALSVERISKENTTVVDIQKEDLMIYLLGLIFDPEKHTTLGQSAAMDEIEHMIEQDHQLKAKITPRVSRVLSDVGLIVRIENELDLCLLWTTGLPTDMEIHKDWLDEDLLARCRVLAIAVSHMKQAFHILGALGDPTDGRYNYPCEQRRTKKITEAMQSAERKLDYFWNKLGYDFRRATCISRKTIPTTLNQSVSHIFTNFRTVERTPDWVAPARPVKIFPTSLQTPIDIPQSSNNEPISSFVAPQEKIKPKTRRVHDSSGSLAEDNPELPPSEPKERIYKLKARGLKVFKVLFFQPSETNLPGDLPWTEFKYAMAAMGFSVHKLDGSTCHFIPPSTDEYIGKHGIQFHEPHSPGSAAKLHFHVARAMGKRLKNTYGWHGGMFVGE